MNRNNGSTVFLLATLAMLVFGIQHYGQRATAYVSDQNRNKFISNCTLESGTIQPHMNISLCPESKRQLLASPGGAGISDHDINMSVNDPRFNQPSVTTTPASPNLLNSTQLSNALGDETTKLQNEADSLKAEIANTDFTQTGVVKPLIEKVAYYSGQVSVMGGSTWSMLHSVEDALIAKIKAAGPSAFSPDEQSFITSWVNGAMKDRQDHPDYSSQVLPGFNQ